METHGNDDSIREKKVNPSKRELKEDQEKAIFFGLLHTLGLPRNGSAFKDRNQAFCLVKPAHMQIIMDMLLRHHLWNKSVLVSILGSH